MHANLHHVAEARSLALHRLLAERLPTQPALLDRARARVQGWLASGSVARPYAEAWETILSQSTPQIVATLVDPGENVRALRQVSPFAGSIDPRTRWDVWRRVRKEWGR